MRKELAKEGETEKEGELDGEGDGEELTGSGKELMKLLGKMGSDSDDDEVPCYPKPYGPCLENKKLGVGVKFLSYQVFGGYGGGTDGVRDRFAVGGRRD